MISGRGLVVPGCDNGHFIGATVFTVVNVGIPAPAACLPFGGMKSSQFADIKTRGTAALRFYTEDKIVTERYWPEE